jgi:hypothetical protein
MKNKKNQKKLSKADEPDLKLKAVIEALIMQLSQEEIDIIRAEEEPAPAYTPDLRTVARKKFNFRKPLFAYIASFAIVAIICLSVVLPSILGGLGGLPQGGNDNGGTHLSGGNDAPGVNLPPVVDVPPAVNPPVENPSIENPPVVKEYLATNAYAVGFMEGIFFDDIYYAMLEADNMVVFDLDNILLAGQGFEERHKDDGELLSYVLRDMVVLIDNGPHAFAIFNVGYRVRFVEQYQFTNYGFIYSAIKDSGLNFKVRDTEVNYLVVNNGETNGDMPFVEEAYIAFNLYGYDCFLTVTTIDIGDFISPLSEKNLIMLVESLLNG